MKRPRSAFQTSLDYVYESRLFILSALGLFFFSALFSFLFPSLFSALDETLRELALKAEGLTGFQLFVFIFHNNLTSSFFALFLGVFLGIFPFFNALLNGAVLGYVVSRVVPLAGVGTLWRLLPHGIFELPAIFISIGLGIKLGFSIFSPTRMRTFSSRFAHSLRAFLYIILPLLLIAALIEALLIALF